jgi:CBS domain-containing protein
MNARDIMTAPVITITPDTPVREIVALLLAHHISGVPVVANERVIGMVNESDLLHRHEIGTDGEPPPESWWKRFMQRDQLPSEYVKSHARQAKDIMTRELISITEDTPLRQISSIFETRRIRRLGVLRGERLVGIVTRADLVQALAQAPDPEIPRSQSDEAIRVRLLAELEQQPWWRPGWSAVHVRDGVVYYKGLLENEDERNAARIAAENVPGVRGVEDERMQAALWQPML